MFYVYNFFVKLTKLCIYELIYIYIYLIYIYIYIYNIYIYIIYTVKIEKSSYEAIACNFNMKW